MIQGSSLFELISEGLDSLKKMVVVKLNVLQIRTLFPFYLKYNVEFQV